MKHLNTYPVHPPKCYSAREDKKPKIIYQKEKKVVDKRIWVCYDFCMYLGEKGIEKKQNEVF